MAILLNLVKYCMVVAESGYCAALWGERWSIGDEDVKYIVLSGWSCDYLFRMGCEKYV